MAKIEGREMQTQEQRMMCYRRGNRALDVKPLRRPSTSTRLCRTYFFFSLLNSAIAHSINQYEIGPFLTTSQVLNGLLKDVGMVRKCFSNEPLKDMTMERMRVEEFEESLCDDCG